MKHESKYQRHQGKQECERRRKQLARQMRRTYERITRPSPALTDVYCYGPDGPFIIPKGTLV